METTGRSMAEERAALGATILRLGDLAQQAWAEGETEELERIGSLIQTLCLAHSEMAR